MDCRQPGSSVHGTIQARILEWVAIPFSRDLPNPGLPHCRRILYLPGSYQGSPESALVSEIPTRSPALPPVGFISNATPMNTGTAVPSRSRLFGPEAFARENNYRPPSHPLGAPRSPAANTPTCRRSPLQPSFREGSDRHPIQIAGPASSAFRRYFANLYAAATCTCVRARPEPCQASTSPSQEQEWLRGLEETPPLAAGNTMTKETSCWLLSSGTTFCENLAEDPFG